MDGKGTGGRQGKREKERPRPPMVVIIIRWIGGAEHGWGWDGKGEQIS